MATLKDFIDRADDDGPNRLLEGMTSVTSPLVGMEEFAAADSPLAEMQESVFDLDAFADPEDSVDALLQGPESLAMEVTKIGAVLDSPLLEMQADIEKTFSSIGAVGTIVREAASDCVAEIYRSIGTLPAMKVNRVFEDLALPDLAVPNLALPDLTSNVLALGQTLQQIGSAAQAIIASPALEVATVCARSVSGQSLVGAFAGLKPALGRFRRLRRYAEMEVLLVARRYRVHPRVIREALGDVPFSEVGEALRLLSLGHEAAAQALSYARENDLRGLMRWATVALWLLATVAEAVVSRTGATQRALKTQESRLRLRQARKAKSRCAVAGMSARHARPLGAALDGHAIAPIRGPNFALRAA